MQELIGQTLRQRKINVFHIIDGHTLGGKNISDLPYSERYLQNVKYLLKYFLIYKNILYKILF